MQIDMDSLWRTESELRERVECAPANAEARRDLAWCLILLAMYQAGIEQTTGKRIAEQTEAIGESAMSGARRETRSAEQLLHEHFWHAQVLNVLPSSRQPQGTGLYDIGIGQMVGASLLATQVKKKYDDAIRRLIADLQDPSEALNGESR